MHDPYERFGFDPKVFPAPLRVGSYFLALALVGGFFLSAVTSVLIS